MAHAFNPSRQRQADFCEFDASLVYRASSKTARIIQRNPVSNSNNKKTMNVCSTLPKYLLQAHDLGACSLDSGVLGRL